MEKEKYVPTRCWCWSPIKGAKLSALKNNKTLPEIEEYIKEHNAVVYYRQRFYESVYDVPFVQEYSIIHTFCCLNLGLFMEKEPHWRNMYIYKYTRPCGMKKPFLRRGRKGTLDISGYYESLSWRRSSL
jgi:hypothetical protein